MLRYQSAILATVLVLGLGQLAAADDQYAKAVIDKAVKALGGAEKRRGQSRPLEDQGQNQNQPQ